ncbi:MAG: hypothetical protein JEZ09_10190 [Salinivirgaceae bacterium]|nr:hypothetical protein [Salinivirgaceae bacterium]
MIWIFDNCIKNIISPMIWSPLAGGRLFSEESELVNRVKKVLFEIVEETGAMGIDQVALAWINQHPSKPHTIIGTLKPERIISAVEAQKIK